MKNLHTFEEFLNESFKIDSKGETLLSKMNIDGPNGKWVLNLVDLDDDGDQYVVITGKYAKSTTSEDTVWIPKNQFEEFKRIINSI
jgi:hypothetical protein